MTAWSSTPLSDSLTRADCHATTGSSKAHCWTVADVGRIPAGLGPVTALRELAGDDPVQLSPRGRAVGAVPGGVLTGPGRRRRSRRSVHSDALARGDLPGLDDRDQVRVDRAEQAQGTA